MEKISIVVPVYNVEKYLVRCLESILNQGINNYEVILVDDGSTDTSGKLCDQYAQRYDNFYVVHKDNQGLGYARNTGMEYAKGSYLFFVDSDDYLEEDFIKMLYLEMKEKQADTCIGGYYTVSKDKKVKGECPLESRLLTGEAIKREFMVRITGKLPDGSDLMRMSVWGTLFKMEYVKKNHIQFPSEREIISEDLFFVLDYYDKAKAIYISSTVGYCYCDNMGSLTKSYRKDRFKLQKRLLIQSKKKLEDLNIYRDCEYRVLNNFVSNVRHTIRLEVHFSSLNGKKHCIRNIREICNDKVLMSVIRHFPNTNVPFKPRIMNYLLKYRQVYLLYWIAKAYKF